ncbi:carbohydrate-binding domain-containing protein [Saccharibacillus sp. JS10]|uniref:carbohydrate-binding domain-containing protein n=1 Tax=Saccharibacillus sp. JS10 TaxID=2950552 RepID=UPI00210862A4|nr:carbohydrate-binding domain-containing protein [Saccharibacillus sp. JS10]MCQ4087899.1 carbohydrate-binding domain-containing protein [Saccharibacillus sp. JS10]
MKKTTYTPHKRSFQAKKLTAFALFLSAMLTLSACSSASTYATSSSASTSTTSAVVSSEPIELSGVTAASLSTLDDEDRLTEAGENATTITLNGTTASVKGTGAAASNGSVTISAAGTYVISGTLSDGQIIVNTTDAESVHLILSGVNLTDLDNAPIYIQSAEKVILTLAEGTDNVVTDGDKYTLNTDEEPSAAIFSKANLTINGTGNLTVTANYNDGITSKDDLNIVSGNINIQAADDGLVGKDHVYIENGTIHIDAVGDGIKSTNDEDSEKGWIAIQNGVFDITAGRDGIQSETQLVIDDGDFQIVTGTGHENGPQHTEENGGGFPGGAPRDRNEGGTPPDMDNPDFEQMAPQDGSQPAPPEFDAAMDEANASETSTDTTATETESESMKGIKAGVMLSINGGAFQIDSADDALHSNGAVEITGGDLHLSTGDDAIHGETNLIIADGTIDIPVSYEGLEAQQITIDGGDVQVVASDDGVNASEASNSDSATTTASAPGMSAGQAQLTINGGTLTVDSQGDGLDSNGSIVMTGGTVTVAGPTNDGNGALDYDGTFEITGGTLIATGSAGMAQAPSDDSAQRSIAMTFPEAQAAGTAVVLKNNAGQSIATVTPSKEFRSVVISSADLQSGGTYALSANEADVVTFTLADAQTTWLNESGITTGNTQGIMGGRGRRQ